MAQPTSEVLLGELLLPTSHAILMAAPVVLLDSYSQNWSCILVSSSFSRLHTLSYWSLLTNISHISPFLSVPTHHPISKSLKILLLDSCNGPHLTPLLSVSSPKASIVLPQSSLYTVHKIIFLNLYLSMSHFCLKTFPLLPCYQIDSASLRMLFRIWFSLSMPIIFFSHSTWHNFPQHGFWYLLDTQ